ncbi:hypothetical protein Tco_0260413 [Tanacetum coccineum]
MEFETKVSTTKDISTAETLVYIGGVQPKTKVRLKWLNLRQRTKTKLQQRQERAGYEAAIRLQEQLDEEERKRIAQGYKQKKEKNTLKLKKQDCLQNLSTREKDILPNKELKKGGTSHSHKLNRELISTMRRVGAFVPMETEIRREVHELAAGSSKKDAKEELDQGSSKRQNTSENSEPAEESKEKEDDELSQEELQVGNHTEVYQIFEDMLKSFDRDDLVKLWSLVQERFNSIDPTKNKAIQLWVELKRLFEPNVDDELWKSQKHVHDITWRLREGVSFVKRCSYNKMLAAKLLVEQNNEDCPRENFF